MSLTLTQRVAKGKTVKMLSEKDNDFLNKRKRLVATGAFVLGLILVFLCAGFVYMFISSPYMANPLYVAEAIKQNSIENSTMIMATILLPIIVIVLFVVVVVFVLFVFSIFSNEKRYLSMIEKLQNNQNKSHGRVQSNNG